MDLFAIIAIICIDSCSFEYFFGIPILIVFTYYKECNFISFSYYCCTGGTLWHLQKFLKYIIVEWYIFPHFPSFSHRWNSHWNYSKNWFTYLFLI
jgi:hypothetical protein